MHNSIIFMCEVTSNPAKMNSRTILSGAILLCLGLICSTAYTQDSKSIKKLFSNYWRLLIAFPFIIFDTYFTLLPYFPAYLNVISVDLSFTNFLNAIPFVDFQGTSIDDYKEFIVNPLYYLLLLRHLRYC